LTDAGTDEELRKVLEDAEQIKNFINGSPGDTSRKIFLKKRAIETIAGSPTDASLDNWLVECGQQSTTI